MLRSILHDYSDAYILGIGTITVASKERAASPTNREEKVISKNCAPFTDCKFEINNTRVDNAKDIDEVMPVQNLIDYSNNYSKRLHCLWQYYRDQPVLNNVGVIIYYTGNTTDLFNFKQKTIGKVGK